MCFFSIIVPTYNSERTLITTINSVLNQSFSNFELLIIDGNSTDSTLQIVKAFAEKDPRVKWLSEKDKGIYDAMNKGIIRSKGKWLYFLGSDDSFYSGSVLQEIKCFIEKRPDLNLVYGKVYMEFFTGSLKSDLDLLYYSICHQAIFYKREIFNLVGFFSLKYKVSADWYHNLMWYSCFNVRFSYIDCCVANYARDGFSSKNKDISFLNDLNINIIKYLKRLHKRNLMNLKWIERKSVFKQVVLFLKKEVLVCSFLSKTYMKIFSSFLARGLKSKG
jgi:glycosyltransferase involved in cell wall biosynthesis